MNWVLKTLRKNYWKEVLSKDLGAHLLISRGNRMNLELNPDELPPDIYPSFLKEHHMFLPHPEYLFNLKRDSVVEHSTGYVTCGNRIVIDSLGRTFETKLPTVLFRKKRRRIEGPVINLRHTLEGNYFHFISDILPILFLCDEAGIPSFIPVIISPNFSDHPYFWEITKLCGYPPERFIIQKDEDLLCTDVFYGNTHPSNKHFYTEFISRLGGEVHPPTKGNRIFLNRRNTKIRTVINNSAVVKVLQAYGFKEVYTDGMSVLEQRKLFSQAERVVGIHGAGLTNLLFRKGNPCSVLELFPANHISPIFYYISEIFGFNYKSLVCESPVKDGYKESLLVDITSLKNSIEAMR